MIQKHKGAASELLALIWLLKQDYEVYRNVSQHGICDMIAVKGEELIKIDVKSCGYLPLGKTACAGPTIKQTENNIKILSVDLKNEVIKGWFEEKPLLEIICEICCEPFKTTKVNQRFCKKQCKINGYQKRKSKDRSS